MTTSLPEIRVTVNWADDAFFQKPMATTDPLNILPSPLDMVDIDRAPTGAGASFTESAELTDYGHRKIRCVAGTGVFGGFLFGKSAGGSINTIPVNASTSYRATIWVKGISGSYGTTPIVLEVKDQSSASLGASSNVTLTANWQQVSLSFSTGVGDTHVVFFVIKNNNATNITFDIAGFMLTAGSVTPSVYNTGHVTSRYQDVSADILMATWDSRMNRETFIPDEGQLTLTLDNSDRRYSPRYTSSPLYGYMQHDLRVKVEIKRYGGAWIEMWSGWITGYDIHAGGTRGDFQAILTAAQGMFNLDAVSLVDNVQENVGVQEVIDSVITSGWYPPTTPYVTILGTSRLDVDAWMPDYAEFRTLDTSITELPLVGDGWTEAETRPTTVLKDLLEVERGWLFFNRSNHLVFKNRQAFIWNTTADETVSLDTQAQGATYRFAPMEINAVTATYYPSGIEENQIVHVSRGTKLVKANNNRRLHAKFQYEEGSKITVKSLNQFGTGSDDSSLTGVDATGNVIDTRFLTGTVEMRNGRGVITAYNSSGVDAYVRLTIKGTIETKADSEEISRFTENTDAKLKNQKLDNRLVKTEEMAVDLADYIITYYGQDFDEFTDMKIEARDATWLDRQLDLEPGLLVALSEYQTGVSGKKQLIVGEEHTWTPGHLITIFQLARIDETDYWILGTSALNEDTRLGY